MDISKKLVETHSLTKEECLELFSLFNNSEVMEYLKEEAVKVRKQYYGTKVFTRGLIEFTNYCKNNCYYCGIRRDNRNVERYRLSEEEILACCANGEKLGFRTTRWGRPVVYARADCRYCKKDKESTSRLCDYIISRRKIKRNI